MLLRVYCCIITKKVVSLHDFCNYVSMRTKDLIAKRERRARQSAKKQSYHPSAKQLPETAVQEAYTLPSSFGAEVLKELKALPLSISDEEILRRRDMREVLTFTIDPEDAKDFDDALSYEVLQDDHGEVRYRIGIHIADVTHYVQEGSAVDEEAYQRGTSIYLVDRVIPMLPEQLSNELCSLRPNEDKLCMSVIVDMDKQAKVLRHKICRTVIRSDYRLTYEEALGQLTVDNGQLTVDNGQLTVDNGQLTVDNGQLTVDNGELVGALQAMNELAKQLRKKRFEHGAINFETPEVRFRLNEHGEPIEIVFHQSTAANHLIEEFMLLANRIVAKEAGGNGQLTVDNGQLTVDNGQLTVDNGQLTVDNGQLTVDNGQLTVDKKGRGKAFVYRVHDVPDPEKLVKLGNFIRQFGFHLRTSSKRSVQNKHINSLLDSCQGTNSQSLIETLAIRTMAKAVYSTSNIGHYGLGFTHYTHFTSPIRRYPDMMVHRLLAKYILHSKQPCRHQQELLEEACVHCSDTEQMAQMAERNSIKEMQARWMSQHIGEEFEGVISGVTEFGLFVQLKDTLTEGLVPIRTIEPHDYMQYDEDNYCLVAARSGITYTLSDTVRVRVVRADVEKKQIDFVLVE